MQQDLPFLDIFSSKFLRSISYECWNQGWNVFGFQALLIAILCIPKGDLKKSLLLKSLQEGAVQDSASEAPSGAQGMKTQTDKVDIAGNEINLTPGTLQPIRVGSGSASRAWRSSPSVGGQKAASGLSPVASTDLARPQAASGVYLPPTSHTTLLPPLSSLLAYTPFLRKWSTCKHVFNRKHCESRHENHCFRVVFRQLILIMLLGCRKQLDRNESRHCSNTHTEIWLVL